MISVVWFVRNNYTYFCVSSKWTRRVVRWPKYVQWTTLSYVEHKGPTRSNRLVFYCKTYCSLNMFRAPLCPSSGAQELYRWLLPVVLGALVYRSLVWCGAVGLCVRVASQTGHINPQRQVPQAATICITLEILMMGIMVRETCWANTKFCNKKQICCI